MKVKIFNTPCSSINNFAKRIKTKMHPNKTLPILSIPLVAYYIGQRSDEYAAEILKFMQNKNIQIPLGSKVDPSDNAGFSSGTKVSIRQSLKNAYEQGKITKNEYEIYDGKVSFTGREHQNSDTDLSESIEDNFNDIPEVDFASTGVPEHQSVTLDNPNFMSADIKDVDVSLPKHLQNIVDSKEVELIEDNGLEDLLTEMGDTLKSGHDATSFFEKLFENIL